MDVWQKFVKVVFRDVLIIGNFGAVPKIVVSWTLLVHHLLQLVLRSGSLTSQKDLKYNKLSRFKEFSWSGIGTVILFCCWTTSPKVDLQFKHVIILKIQKQPPEVLYLKRCSLKFRKICRITPVPECFSDTGVFLWILRNFKEHLFTENLWVTASQNRKYELVFKAATFR